MDRFTYLSLMLGALIGPLCFSFEKRVAFFRHWPRFFAAALAPALFFLAWDVWFNARGVWSFSDTYTLGLRFLGLPVEEWAFFFVIPYCGLFTHAVIKTYVPGLATKRPPLAVLVMVLVCFIVLAAANSQRAYTFWNFSFSAGFLGFLLLNRWFRPHLPHFLATYLVTLLPMLLVNGVLTALPVVSYHPEHILGLKVFAIPVEDFFYYFLLLMMNVMIYERLEPGRKTE